MGSLFAVHWCVHVLPELTGALCHRTESIAPMTLTLRRPHACTLLHAKALFLWMFFFSHLFRTFLYAPQCIYIYIYSINAHPRTHTYPHTFYIVFMDSSLPLSGRATLLSTGAVFNFQLFCVGVKQNHLFNVTFVCLHCSCPSVVYLLMSEV